MNHRIKVAVVQHACGQDYTRNLEQSMNGIREAVKQGATVVLLPELHALPYFCVEEDSRYFDLAEPIPGPTTETLSKLARELGIIIIASIFEKRAKGLYHNTAVVIEKDGTLAGSYRKMHIPDDPGYYEKFYFTPGDQGFVPIDTSAGKLGVLICWDQW
ncbi:MAG: nitrilase-related carbon-nitrogen hydrolase, partial [Gammaproteobacteria bacterium]